MLALLHFLFHYMCAFLVVWRGFSMAETRLPSALAGRLSMLNLSEQLAKLTTGYSPDAQKELQEPSYYDYPVLQRAVWHWAIIWYFFFGGLAAGCYVIPALPHFLAHAKTVQSHVQAIT